MTSNGGANGTNSGQIASKEAVKTILEAMESLLVANDGRSLTHSACFGGVSKLAKEITAYLSNGTIHRDPDGEECCASFINSCISNCHPSLKPETSVSNAADIEAWIRAQILEANLHPALSSLLKDKQSLENNYEKHSFARQRKSTKKLLNAAKSLDDLDVQGLAEVICYGCLRRELLSQSPEPQPMLKLSKDSMKKFDKEIKPLVDAQKPDQRESGPLVSSCPGLTDKAFTKYLDDRRWCQPPVEPVVIMPTGAIPKNSHTQLRDQTGKNYYSIYYYKSFFLNKILRSNTFLIRFHVLLQQ